VGPVACSLSGASAARTRAFMGTRRVLPDYARCMNLTH
jgi:hypothetical protein